MVSLSGSVMTYAATQIATLASLTSTLISSTTNAVGTNVGIVISPSASGKGWVFQYPLSPCGNPFPPPPPQRPAPSNTLPSTVIISESTGAYSPTIVTAEASLTTTLLTSTTDASGATVCLILYPPSGGHGWIFHVL